MFFGIWCLLVNGSSSHPHTDQVLQWDKWPWALADWLPLSVLSLFTNWNAICPKPNINLFSPFAPTFQPLFLLTELLCSCRNLCGGNLVHKQRAWSLSGDTFFMSENESSCSRLCHPPLSRQTIPRIANSRSFRLADSINTRPICLSTSTAACQTSSTATRCPVWLQRWADFFFHWRPLGYWWAP